jgi:hypothetical protein
MIPLCLLACQVLSESPLRIMLRTVQLLPMLDRAHSWLRTVSLSRGLKTLAGPVKALMELLVTFKQARAHGPHCSVGRTLSLCVADATLMASVCVPHL